MTGYEQSLAQDGARTIMLQCAQRIHVSACRRDAGLDVGRDLEQLRDYMDAFAPATTFDEAVRLVCMIALEEADSHQLWQRYVGAGEAYGNK